MNWMRFRPLYLLISGSALGFAVWAILTWGFRLSIDFTGGSIVEYRVEGEEQVKSIERVIDEETEYRLKDLRSLGPANVEFRFGPEFVHEDSQKLTDKLKEEIDDVEFLKYETVGPVLSQELLRKTYIAIAIATFGILVFVAWSFKSFKFGLSAILAMLHDILVVLGAFAVLGYYRGVEIDILFVTAVLTTLSFSVHDTIVVYDRIRESARKFPGESVFDLANKAVSETMVRSVNNSLTIIFMLFALFLMGGLSVKWFVFALLVGTISGTYSSPFVAVPILVTWDQIQKRIRNKIV